MVKQSRILMYAVVGVVSLVGVALAQSDIEADMLKFWGPVPPGGVEAMSPGEIKQANENLKTAVDPMLDMFGFVTGGGLYNTADVHGVLGFDVGVKMTAMMVGTNQKPQLNGLSANLKNGPLGDESVIPVPVLHVGLGLTGNLELIGRYFSFPMGKEGSADGNITLIGVGAKYGLLQTFGLPKIAVLAAYHRLSVPAEFQFDKVNNFSAAIVASYSLPALATIYGGAGIDYSSFTIDFPDPFPDPDAFHKQNFRANVGVKINPIPLLPLFVNVDYNFGAIKGISGGLGISLR